MYILNDLSILSGNRFFFGPIGSVLELVTFQLPLGDCRTIESVLEFVTFQLPLGDCNKDSFIFAILVGVINIIGHVFILNYSMSCQNRYINNKLFINYLHPYQN